MSINLSDLTSPNNQDSLAEITSGADFLDPIGKLKNLSRSPNSGSDALQTVALNQPKALPLIDGDGYLYVSGVNGNCALIPDESALDVSGDLTLEADVTLPSYPPSVSTRIISKYYTTGNQRSYLFYVSTSGHLGLVLSSTGSYQSANEITSSLTLQYVGISQGQRVKLKAVWRASDGRLQFFYKIKGGDYTQLGTDRVNSAGSIYNGTASVVLGGDNEGTSSAAQAAIHSAKIYASINDTNKVLDVDFTATNVRHGDTKFKCATGQIVTINTAGNDKSTIIKKPVLRFANQSDGSTTIGLDGLFSQEFNGGYMFAALSVLGDGGGSYAHVFATNKTGGNSDSNGGVIFSYRPLSASNLGVYRGTLLTHNNLFDSDNGDFIVEHKATNTSSISKVNDADTKTSSLTYTIESDEFKIGKAPVSTNNAAFDLEFLALFPADSVPDEATASKIRNYINKRNQIYLRHQTDGFYFFNPQKLAAGDVTSWNGNITGSDLGDTDVATNVTIVQGSQTSQPNADGYSLTFEDNTQHLEWASAYTPNFPAGQTKAWQIVGTSLGTFAYLTQGSVTELNLLGNLGNVNQRKTGSLYGVILIPESATGADIEEARNLLIDRGSEDASPTTIASAYWASRTDIIEFKNTDFPNAISLSYAWDGCNNMTQIGTLNAPVATNFNSAWKSCSSLTSFPAGAKLGTSAQNVNFTEAWRESGLTSFNTDLPTGTIFQKTWRQSALTSFGSIDLSSGDSFNSSWQLAASLSSFGAIDARNGTTFQEAWRDCSSLTQFPENAKLGTEANNVSFDSAWRASGLTSFSTPLPTGNIVYAAWRDCSNLVSFTSEINASNVRFSWYGCSSLTSFSTPLSNANRLDYGWRNCTSLTDFSADVFANWNPSSLVTGMFDNAWKNTALTAASVENILVGISNSGKYATTNGASGGSALGNAAIDIDYNAASGSLSAATNSAVTSLKSKGWSIIVNNVTL